jgi:multiple sugar transport system substrate-binding protein
MRGLRRLLGLTALVTAVALAASGGRTALAGSLSINANTSDPAPRAAWLAVVEDFRRAHPEIEVRFNVYDHESYKKSIRNWLTSAAPDVVFWNAGNRMRQFVAVGLLEDVSDLYEPAVRAVLNPAALDLVSAGGRQYGVPVGYYQIGLFFRQDLLDAAGLAGPPGDWPALLAACDALNRVGVVPVAIGTRDLWPAAAWFDYLNLRLNGYGFHMALMAGQVAYTDPRVRAVFAHWAALVERRCFQPGHAGSSWQEGQALLHQGRAAMMLIGNFAVRNFPAELRERIGFARFPTIAAGVAPAEDAPMNSLHIPARARNKAEARRFLAYVLRADVQARINAAQLTIPVNAAAAVADDRFLRQGRALLAEATHLAQYFDRDTSEELATVAMKGFQEFMTNPQRLDAVLENIERARRRIYM